MDADFVHRLTAQSTLAELPAFDTSLDLSTKGQALGETFDRSPHLPGVVVMEGDGVRGVISRGQYLRLVGRRFGLEVFLPRPLRLMFEAIQGGDEEPLLLDVDTPVQDAVGRALERPRSLIYEPVIVQGLRRGRRELRLIDFPDLLRADSRISTLRNRQMQEILSTVQEGFLLVDGEHRIAAEYSRSIEVLFGSSGLADRRLPAVLAEILPEASAQLARDYLGVLFNPNVIESLVADINPLQRVETRPGSSNRGGGPRHLAFSFRRSVEEGTIRRILVRVEDVSREVELAEEIDTRDRRAQERVDLVFDILRTDLPSTAAWLDRLGREVGRARTWLGGPSPLRNATHAGLAALFRALHGLKGEAGLLELGRFQRRLHAAEDALATLRDGPTMEALEPLRERIAELEDLAAEGEGILDQLRGLQGPMAASAPSTGPVPSIDPAPSSDPTFADPAFADEESSLFRSISLLTERLAGRLGKPTRFLTRCAEEEIPGVYRDLVRGTLVQLVRNALVHGIEAPEIRRARGKAPVGVLQFALRRHLDQGRIELIFQDDGGGLDLDAIRRRAEARGLTVEDGRGAAAAIFESGLSTAAETTVDAGRGVGLDLVKSQVEAHGGYVATFSEPGKFCAFQIVLPWTVDGEAP
ncbi:MAG: ATP-binding protein [Acidobacteriota bacterium]